MSGSHAVCCVLLEDRLITLNRAVGLIRRRNLPRAEPCRSGPTGTPGLSRLTIMMQSDSSHGRTGRCSTCRRSWACARPSPFPRRGVARELALVKVRRPARALRRAARRGSALPRSLSWTSPPTAVILELSGSEAFVLSCLRALERFEMVEVARSGTVALGTSGTDLQSGSSAHDDAPCGCTTTPTPSGAGWSAEPSPSSATAARGTPTRSTSETAARR